MPAIDIRSLIAGLAGGAQYLGNEITTRKAKERAEQQDEASKDAASKRALALLLAGKNFDLDNAPPVTREVQDPDDPTQKKLQQFNRRTQTWEDAMNAGAPPVPSPDRALASLADVPKLPPPVTRAIPGNPQLPSAPRLGGPTVDTGTAPTLSPTLAPTVPVTPPTSPTTAPIAAPRVLRPAPKTPPVAPRPHLVKDERGNYVPVGDNGLGPDGKPVKAYTPPVQPQILGGVDGEGKPHFFAINKGTSTATPVQGLVPHESDSQKTSALMLQAMNRLGLSEGDIASAITQMDAFENDPKNRAALTAGNQTLGQVAMAQPDVHASGLGALVGNSAATYASAKARAKLNAEFPELLTYLRNKQIVGLAATEILPRPNAQLLGIESGIAGIANDTPDEMVTDIQTRRHRMRDLLHQSLQATPLKDGSSSSRPLSEADWAAKNPPKKGESFDQYHARYLAAAKGG